MISPTMTKMLYGMSKNGFKKDLPPGTSSTRSFSCLYYGPKRARLLSAFWKSHLCKLTSNWTRKTVWEPIQIKMSAKNPICSHTRALPVYLLSLQTVEIDFLFRLCSNKLFGQKRNNIINKEYFYSAQLNKLSVALYSKQKWILTKLH